MGTGSESIKKLEREARDLRKGKDWGQKAVEANTRILEVDPHNTAALNRRAKCYREQKDFLAAEADYHRALELDENANIQNTLKEIREEAFKRAFLLDRERIDVLIELAAVHRTLRRRDEAEKIYEWILRHRADSSAAKVGWRPSIRIRKGSRLILNFAPMCSHKSYTTLTR